MPEVITIGTRRSPLAMLQAEKVASLLRYQGKRTKITSIDSAGDIDLHKPIYELGITGVFTKNLDIALLNHDIDIAVHSLKDVPTSQPKGLCLAAVLERDFPEDVIVWGTHNKPKLPHAKVGTGSLRRMAFLRHAYKGIACQNIRGNVQTRLKKMKEDNMDGVVFSLAGIKRLGLSLEYEILESLIPAPGQGVIAISARQNELLDELSALNHKPTERCTRVERDFLKTLEGGCSSPVGAYAEEIERKIHFRAAICDVNGTEKMEISRNFPTLDFEKMGEIMANELIEQGAKKLFPLK